MGNDSDDHMMDEIPQWQPASWTRLGRVVDPGDPLNTPYAWITDEISDALNSITLGDTRKRRTTILMVADAVASGNREIQEVLADKRTLGHAGWYQRIRNDREFESVYKLCLETAQAWYDGLEGRRLLRRALRVEQSKDELVSLTNEALQVMARLLLDEKTSAHIRRQIATDILDRADAQTATNVNAAVRPEASRGSMSMRDLRRDKPRSIAEIQEEKKHRNDRAGGNGSRPPEFAESPETAAALLLDGSDIDDGEDIGDGTVGD